MYCYIIKAILPFLSGRNCIHNVAILPSVKGSILLKIFIWNKFLFLLLPQSWQIPKAQNKNWIRSSGLRRRTVQQIFRLILHKTLRIRIPPIPFVVLCFCVIIVLKVSICQIRTGPPGGGGGNYLTPTAQNPRMQKLLLYRVTREDGPDIRIP